MDALSTALREVIIRPASFNWARQIRATSTRTRGNITGLDKLHRRQKQAMREERLKSSQRAKTDPRLNFTLETSSTPTTVKDTEAASTDQPTPNSAPLSSSPSPPSQSVSSSSSTPTSTSTTSPTHPSASTPQALNRPYTITRTRIGQQIPVYNLAKGGGTKRLTRLRKVSGDLHALKKDLTTALGLEGGMTNRRGEKVDGVSINWHTRHVVVRGWRGPEVKAWATSMGF